MGRFDGAVFRVLHTRLVSAEGARALCQRYVGNDRGRYTEEAPTCYYCRNALRDLDESLRRINAKALA